MTRRELREHCFKMLFSADFYPSAEEVKEQLGQYFNAPEEEDVDPKGDVTILHKVEIKEEDRRYLEKRVADMMDKIPEIDERINEVAAGWRTKRMGKVELTILRLALFEMKHDDAIPEKVAINEAVELAKKFGGDESPSFVNGILAKFAGKEGRKGAASGAVKETAAKPAEAAKQAEAKMAAKSESAKPAEAKMAAKSESAKPVEEADPEAAKSVEAAEQEAAKPVETAKPESQMQVEAADPEASNSTEQQAITAAAPEADKPGSEAAADQSPAAAPAETAAAAKDEAPSAQTSTASSAEPEKTEAAKA